MVNHEFYPDSIYQNICTFGSSMVASDSSSTNYPGKIPSGPDLPSDVADEKKEENNSSNS